MEKESSAKTSWVLPLLAVLLLGLAPHFPEPHLVEKFRWIFTGEKHLAPIDWFDVLWHSWPWFWLIYALKKRWGFKRELQEK